MDNDLKRFSRLDLSRIDRGLRGLDPTWPPLRYSASTGSTNEDAANSIRAAMASAPRSAAKGSNPANAMGSQPAKRYRVVGEYGPAAWTLFVAEEQTAGRGRLGRSWQVSPGTALLASVVLRPPAEVPVDSSGWVPLLAGLAITAAVAEAGVPARLKWPNDVVVGFPNRKLAGILAERIDSVLVVGFGLNVSADRRQLPVATATSLCLEGARQLSREELLVRTMAHLRRRWDSWVAEAGDARRSGIREEYLHSCETVGCEVKVELPGRETIEGRACDIDTDGRLVVTFGSTQRVVAAGDVVHVRRS